MHIRGSSRSKRGGMVLDSNVLIGYLNGDVAIRDALHAWRETGTVLFISQVSVIEALSYPALDAHEVKDIELFLGDFIAIPIDMEICRRAAELRRIHKFATPDAIIVASAMVNGLPLVTRDRKMRSVKGVDLVGI